MELKIQDLVKNFGGIQALKGITLTLSGNELVGLIGPNGHAAKGSGYLKCSPNTFFGYFIGFLSGDINAVKK